MRTKTLRIAVAFVAVLLFSLPMFAASRGKADFTHLVTLGDSYGAGVESGSLNEHHQRFSWAGQLATAVGAKDFQIPSVSYPGIGPELELISLSGPVITAAAGQGSPLNLNLARPYNNLSIPGARVNDLITLTGKEAATDTPRTFAQFILRGLGTAVQQAAAQQPTFIAVFIGGNDVLGAVLAGTPKVLTPADAFKTAYNTMLDQLIAGAPNAGMVVGNLPTHVAALPYATTIPMVIINPATNQPVLNPADGKTIPYFAILENGQPGLLPAGSLVLLGAKADLQQGYGIPPTLKSVPPFSLLPHAGEPLPDTDTLTPTEISQIEARAAEDSANITAAATSRNIPVADVSALFDRVLARQEFVGPFQFTGSFITGGLFSFDGFHPTDIGYMLIANEFIKAINHGYDTEIPLISLTTFFQNNGALFGSNNNLVFFEGDHFEITTDAVKQIRSFGPTVQTRMRTTSH